MNKILSRLYTGFIRYKFVKLKKCLSNYIIDNMTLLLSGSLLTSI